MTTKLPRGNEVANYHENVKVTLAPGYFTVPVSCEQALSLHNKHESIQNLLFPSFAIRSA